MNPPAVPELQTYLPYWDYWSSLRTLDNKTLAKQCDDAVRLVSLLEETDNKKWRENYRTYPALKMWHGWHTFLRIYANTSLKVWLERGFPARHGLLDVDYRLVTRELPPWFTDGRLHAVHRSQLLRSNPKYYSRYFWNDPIDLPDYWPNGCGNSKNAVFSFNNLTM